MNAPNDTPMIMGSLDDFDFGLMGLGERDGDGDISDGSGGVPDAN